MGDRLYTTVAHIRQFLDNSCFFTAIYRRTIALYRRTIALYRRILLRYIAVFYCVILPYGTAIYAIKYGDITQ